MLLHIVRIKLMFLIYTCGLLIYNKITDNVCTVPTVAMVTSSGEHMISVRERLAYK